MNEADQRRIAERVGHLEVRSGENSTTLEFVRRKLTEIKGAARGLRDRRPGAPRRRGEGSDLGGLPSGVKQQGRGTGDPLRRAQG